MSRVKQEPDSVRGTGRTTRLIRSAPHGAFLVCLSRSEGTRRTQELWRHDLQVVEPDAVRGMP